jgi:thiamine biosynthesis lipoprotein
MSRAWVADRSLIVLAALAAGTIASGAPALERFTYAQVHMGMPVRIQLYADSEKTAAMATTAAFARIAELDGVMSDYKPNSDVRRLHGNGDAWTPVRAELFEVLRQALAVSERTEGAFDPSIAPLVSLWREARQTGRLPAPDVLAAAKASVGWRHVRLNMQQRAIRFDLPRMQLDLGGIAKGYILQDARRVLRALDVASVLIEAGGDIVAGDAPPGRSGWHIDVDSADAAFRARASRLVNAALATSGPTAQFVEIAGVHYSHVIDPRTGLGVTHDVVARVIAEDAATADALATALTVIGVASPDVIARFPGVLVSVGAR